MRAIRFAQPCAEGTKWRAYDTTDRVRQNGRAAQTGLRPYDTTSRRRQERRVEGSVSRAYRTAFRRRQKRLNGVQA